MDPITTRGWTIAQFREAYDHGALVRDVIASVLASLSEAPSGILIGEPLTASALADADRLDAEGNRARPLFGIPVAVKDNIDVAGAETTAACPGFAYVATADAAVVARLRAAGAVIVAKTNMDQFATGLVGTRSPYGTPLNVLDATLVPGGSSSGSAIAVALGLVPVSLGTDTAGSGRVPAALNAIVGLKPTVGRLSGRGIVPAMRRFDCPTVFARTVADAAAVADVMAGPDPEDPFSRQPPHAPPTPPTAVTVGAPADFPAALGVDAMTAACFEAALSRLAAGGTRVVRIPFDDIVPMVAAGRMLYGTALVAERYAAIGHAVSAGIAGLDPVVSGIIGGAAQWSAADAFSAEYDLMALRARGRRIWDRIDVLALPTYPAPVTLAEVAADPVGANARLGPFTCFVNLLDLAAIVVPSPVGVGASSEPFGLQLIAPAWNDAVVEDLGVAYEQGEARHPSPPRDDEYDIVVVGAHLTGQPLNHQLTERAGRFVRATTTAPGYRLYALAGTVPPKPGLVRTDEGGATIEVEVWRLSEAAFGSFVGAVPPPLCIGSVELADGTWSKGFLCEPRALVNATDITHFGGWRAYLAS